MSGESEQRCRVCHHQVFSLTPMASPYLQYPLRELFGRNQCPLCGNTYAPHLKRSVLEAWMAFQTQPGERYVSYTFTRYPMGSALGATPWEVA